MTPNERFWNTVAISDELECWEWTGRRSRGGYGVFWMDGKNRRANRLALEFSGRTCPDDGMVAMHSCDNPGCCNPFHLSWGTVAENHADMHSKNRAPIGGEAGRAILTDAEASKILHMRVEGFTCDQIAEALGHPVSRVMNVYTGRYWRHIHGKDGNPTLEELRRARPSRKRPATNRVLTDEMVDKIFAARMEGRTAKSIADELGVALGTVSPVFAGHSFKDRLGGHGNPTLDELLSVRSPNPNAKLTADDIEEIEALLKAGHTGAAIAKEFGIGRATVSRIKTAMS